MAGAILVLVVVVLLTTGSDAEIVEVAAVSVTGDALPPVPTEAENPDLAVGMTMPEVRGVSFDGETVAITNDGRPKVILFLTHW